MGSLAVFAVFSSKLSTIDTFLSAEILSRRRFSRRNNSQMFTVLPLFSAFFSEGSRPRPHRGNRFRSWDRHRHDGIMTALYCQFVNLRSNQYPSSISLHRHGSVSIAE